MPSSLDILLAEHIALRKVLLFPRLRARTPLARHVLDHLEEDHRRGEARIRELAHALTAFEILGDSRRAGFEMALAHYVEFYRSHVALEESEIFPLAERALLATDWDELDAEFKPDGDPLTGAASQAPYARLFARLRAHLDGLYPA
jgi:hemerythrin-like domain-containing protein